MGSETERLLQQWIDELIDAKNELEAAAAHEKSKKWRDRKYAVHPINQTRKLKQSFYYTKFQQLKQYPDRFKKLMRMHPTTFKVLLKLVKKKIEPAHKTETAILAEQRLFITLMYLAHGVEVTVLALMNEIADSTVYKIMEETCKGIYESLEADYVKFPSTPTWRKTAKKFDELWQLPGCLAAIDGKHVNINAPDKAGSLFWNFKKQHSVVLMAAVNHAYEFLWFDVGSYGGESDGGILSKTKFGRDIENKALEIFNEKISLPGQCKKLNYFFIGDDAFALRSNFMKPYSRQNMTLTEKIFNYRISRARRCVESAFGILVMRFRVFERKLRFQPDKIDMLISACVCLHNFLLTMDEIELEIEDFKEKQAAEVSEESQGADDVPDDDEPADGKAVRQLLTDYFISAEGEVPWQKKKVRRGFRQVD